MLTSIAKSSSCATARSLRRTLASRTHFSSTSTSPNEENPASKPSSSSQVYVNAERKRKLISLFHEAENFITYENLESYIDNEFRRNMQRTDMRQEESRALLKLELAERRERPKTVTVTAGEDSRLVERVAEYPSEKREQTVERRVKAALFGLDESLKAGLETVEAKQHAKLSDD